MENLLLMFMPSGSEWIIIALIKNEINDATKELEDKDTKAKDN